MPNLQAVFEKYPEYRTMCTDTEGHIWALPWIEQLGVDKTAIQDRRQYALHQHQVAQLPGP